MRVLIVFSLLLINAISSAQVYNPMVIDGATWIYGYPGLNVSKAQSYGGYHISGDTLVDGIAYKKLYEVNTRRDNQGNFNLFISSGSLLALIRDDILTKKVYAIFLKDLYPIGSVDEDCQFYIQREEEYLIYDFLFDQSDSLYNCQIDDFIFDEPQEVEIYGITTTEYGYGLYEQIGANSDLFYNGATVIVGESGSIDLVKYCISDSLDDCDLKLSDLVPNYNPMIIEGATWLYKEEFIGIPESLNYQGLQLSGDSIVDGTSYKKMYDVVTEIDNNDSIKYISRNFKILIREDLETRKIYTYGEPDLGIDSCYDTTFINRDYLLYDFGHVQNDTVLFCGDEFKVLAQKELLTLFDLLSIKHSVSSSTEGNIDERYEIFGGSYNFFLPYHTLLTGDAPNRELVAYCITDNLGCPFRHQGPNDIANNALNAELTIYPNPITESVSIVSENQHILSIEIYDLNGRLVYSHNADGPGTRNLRINPRLTSGLYLLKASAVNGASAIRKISITNQM